MKDGLGGKLITKFAGIIGKNYSYLKNDDSEDKEVKDLKKYVIKDKINLKIIKIVWNQLILKIKQSI